MIEKTKDLRAPTSSTGGGTATAVSNGLPPPPSNMQAIKTANANRAAYAAANAPAPAPSLPAAPDPYNFDADMLSQQGDYYKTVMGSQAPTIDTSGMTTAYGQALGTLGTNRDAALAAYQNDPGRQQMLQLAQGQGPAAEAARAQLNAGMDAANAQAMSQAASARGGAGAQALAMRGAMNQGAAGAQQAANQAAMMRAQMGMQGIQGLSEQNAQMLGARQNFAGQQAQLGGAMAGNLGTLAGQQGQLTSNYNLGKFGLGQQSLANMGQYGIQRTGQGINLAQAETDRMRAGTERAGVAYNPNNQAQAVGQSAGTTQGMGQAVDVIGKALKK